MTAQPFVVLCEDRTQPLSVVGEHITVLASAAETGSYEIFFQAGPEGSGPPTPQPPVDEAFYVLHGEVAFGVVGPTRRTLRCDSSHNLRQIAGAKPRLESTLAKSTNPELAPGTWRGFTMTARHTTLFLAAQFTLCLTASAQDHLEPERGMLNQSRIGRDYGQRLRQVLMKDASLYHLGCLVCLPSFEEERMVTLVREPLGS